MGGEKMPLYEYRCRQCRSHLEMLQKVGDKPLKLCPQCGGELEKLISPAAIQFKGSGWYVTDYGRGNQGNGDTARGNGKERAKEKSAAEPTKSDSDTARTESSKK